MENNYTPLDLSKFNPSSSGKKPGKDFNMILLIIATVSAAVLAALLFILIQRRQAGSDLVVPKKTVVSPSVPVKLSPTVAPEIISPTVNVVPTTTASPTASLSPTSVISP